MNTFNNRVGRQHVERAAFRPKNGCVVARADHDPGRLGEALGDAGNKRVLADVGDGAIGHERAAGGGQLAAGSSERVHAARCPLPAVCGSVRCPLCRVGRSNEPAKAGGATVISRASGFLATEACTTRDLAARLGFTLAQTSLRKPSRAKQDLRILACGQGWVKMR